MKTNINLTILVFYKRFSFNPFAYRKQEKLCEEIVKKLNCICNCELKMNVPERCCRDRTTLLLIEFKKGEAFSLRW